MRLRLNIWLTYANLHPFNGYWLLVVMTSTGPRLSESPIAARPCGRHVTIAGRNCSSCLKRGITSSFMTALSDSCHSRELPQSSHVDILIRSGTGKDIVCYNVFGASWGAKQHQEGAPAAKGIADQVNAECLLSEGPFETAQVSQSYCQAAEVISLVSTPLISTIRQPHAASHRTWKRTCSCCK